MERFEPCHWQHVGLWRCHSSVAHARPALEKTPLQIVPSSALMALKVQVLPSGTAVTYVAA